MLIQLDNVSKSYVKGDRAVRAMVEVSLEQDAGEFVAVCGKSGCGKSTLLLTVGGLMRPDAGTVQLDGIDVYALSPEQRAQLRAEAIGFVFQQFHLVPYLNVRDNVLAASLGLPAGAGQPDLDARATELIEQFGMTARAAHVPAELSTGERQRTALARALLNRPKLLLADEPTGNLDVENRAVVLEHLRSFADAGGSVLLVTHDEAAAGCADRVIHIESGRLERTTVSGGTS